MEYRLTVRYCGGCRSAYDRTAFVQQVLDALNDKGMHIHPEYDIEESVGLLVCGCAAQCLLRDIQKPSTWHYIGPDCLFDSIHRSLDSIVLELYNELAGASDTR